MILYRAACCVPRLTQPSTLRGTVKWVSAFGLSNNKWRWWLLGLQPTGGLTAQVGWLGAKVGGRLALPCIRQMNECIMAPLYLLCPCYGAIVVIVVLLLLLLCRLVNEAREGWGQGRGQKVWGRGQKFSVRLRPEHMRPRPQCLMNHATYKYILLSYCI